ncbi:hypothetical protein R1sor_013371 [Riccia sorocarpa]|uniref:Flavin-containing monooxygenase n=1 Tax=Riccia sorocarpa TaxID=122646 RepID=A0ABD3H6C5_9MARC
MAPSRDFQSEPQHFQSEPQRKTSDEAASSPFQNTLHSNIINPESPRDTLPAIQREFWESFLEIPMYQQIAKDDKDFYEGLEKAGFKSDFGEDGSGLHVRMTRRAGGYYINAGASELITGGQIKVKSGLGVQEMRPSSVVFTDGSEVKADLIVYATGYKNMKEFIAMLISPEVADKVGFVWGLGSDTHSDPGPWARELKNMWKPLVQPNLWLTGGVFMFNRQMSRFLAIQLKARMENISTPVFWPEEQTILQALSLDK